MKDKRESEVEAEPAWQLDEGPAAAPEPAPVPADEMVDDADDDALPCPEEAPAVDDSERLADEATTSDVGKELRPVDLEYAVELITQLQYTRAAEMLERLTVEYEAAPDARRAARCWFWLGYCREKQGRTDEARKHYQHVLDKYADETAGQQARRRLEGLNGQT
jgi:tetratricopeptide (TPR) repeat protein